MSESLIELKDQFNLHKIGCKTCVCFTQVEENCPDGKILALKIILRRRELIKKLKKDNKSNG